MIKNLFKNNPILLAPMAGVTDYPFRIICKELGADIVYTEFVSANGIIRENIKTLNMIKFKDKERPIGVQIFGEDPEIVGKSAKMIAERYKPDIIDINFGCPVPKVTKKGAGSAALKNLMQLQEIAHAVLVNSNNIPVTAKIRCGWDSEHIVSTEIGIILEKIGLSAITLHPRTTKQLFTGHSNWDYIKELKQEVNIPIIGNGDILEYKDYIKMKSETKCDGIMIGRGALGNPWIFRAIKNNLSGIQNLDITLYDRIELCIKHFNLLKETDYPLNHIINLTKKHFYWYLKGFSNAQNLRKEMVQCNSMDDLNRFLNKHRDDKMSTLKS